LTVKHVEKLNHTDLEVELVLTTDQEGFDSATVVLKGTYDIGATGALAPAEEPQPIMFDGEFNGDPDTSSYRLEPECTMPKPATDVVLLGHARSRGATVVDVGVSVGSLSQVARVFGDRVWYKSMGQVRMSEPQPFETISLIYEHAFGGWDRTPADESKHAFEPRNPVGRGFRAKGTVFEDGLRLPNIENARQFIKGFGDRPPPVGFGFTAPHWKPRSKLAGTYDEAWSKDRAPLLPVDFNPSFLNAAPESLIAPRYLRGDEDVELMGVTPEGRLGFRLPGLRPPSCRVSALHGEDAYLSTNLDTIVIDADARQVTLTWRQGLRLDRGHRSVRALEVQWDAFDRTRSAGGTT
jgi:hypothetical protein